MATGMQLRSAAGLGDSVEVLKLLKDSAVDVNGRCAAKRGEVWAWLALLYVYYLQSTAALCVNVVYSMSRHVSSRALCVTTR